MSSWFIIEPPEVLSGTFWELKDSDVSFDSGAEEFSACVLLETWGSTSDATPFAQGASMTCSAEKLLHFHVE